VKTPAVRVVWVRNLLTKARVGHLATSTKEGRPLVVPICFAFDGIAIYSVIDEKPKRVNPRAMRRVLNIVENPNVCFVVDQYSEDWRKLRYVIVRGKAAILTKGKEHSTALLLLRKKYQQYHSMNLDDRPIIKIRPTHIIAWNATSRIQ